MRLWWFNWDDFSFKRGAQEDLQIPQPHLHVGPQMSPTIVVVSDCFYASLYFCYPWKLMCRGLGDSAFLVITRKSPNIPNLCMQPKEEKKGVILQISSTGQMGVLWEMYTHCRCNIRKTKWGSFRNFWWTNRSSCCSYNELHLNLIIYYYYPLTMGWPRICN